MIDMDNGHGIKCDCAKCQPYLADNERKQLRLRITSLESENAKLKADRVALVEALGEADELIAIEPFEHVAEEAAESHRNIRALLSNLRGGE